MDKKKVYVVLELHSDCPKIRGIFEDKAEAERVAYRDTEFWRNVVALPINEAL